MQINLSNLGKRYNFEWIFRNLSYEFSSGSSYAILGHNGSGKSTLLNIISGHHLSSEGTLTYSLQNKPLPAEKLYQYLSITAPHLELVEELTLQEMLQFHIKFKPLRHNLSTQQLLDRMNLTKARDKHVKDFSSGMKQRLKLALAIYADTPLLLLDEPTTNLDEEGVAWYRQHLFENMESRLVIVGSNILHEYDFCEHRLRISDFHPKPRL
ncbi:MAG: ABC transporter ATP-binding protein [Hymenobacteraceae bacterium]|nr:ABC transporter ATP-binding protein [Hymenobacteraceae bacterium]MDX5394596.1 ABC transporter ATP-binding protein [Hymenobacteraceae bacterium]MDX5510624.1 ABC transporter ATP-binding protein [Hymenobacteraceae bacterium]